MSRTYVRTFKNSDHKELRLNRNLRRAQLSKKVRAILATIAMVLGLGVSTAVMATPAAAATTLCSGSSYSSCTGAGYTDHGYSSHSGTSYWGAYAGHNCTNYVAYVESTVNGASSPGNNLGNAANWGANAAAKGYAVNSTPAPGSVAWWDANTPEGSDGHVAYVEQLLPNNGIRVSEDVYSAGPFRWRDIYPGDAYWPTNFIHFKDITPPNGQPDLLLTRVGGTLFSKVNIGDTWVTQTTAAADVKASGGRIAIVDTSGNLQVKDGPNGTWYTETGAVDQYVVTPNLLVIRVGGTVYAKAQLTDSWSTVVGGGATDIQAVDNTMAFRDTNGTLWAKVGVGGQWQQEIGNVSQYVVTSSLLLARVGNTLYTKANIGDAWTTQTDAATDVKASGGRIVITATDGTVYAKDGPNGTWYAETGATDQVVVTPNLLVIRVGGTVYAKAQLYDAWSTVVGGGATDVKATNNTMAFVDSNGTLWAKVGVNGTWQQEIGSVSQFVVS